MRKREELELQEYKDKVSRPKNAKRNKEHQRKSCYSLIIIAIAVTVSSSLQKLLQFNHHCKSCYSLIIIAKAVTVNHHCKSCYSLIIIAKAVTVSYSLLVMRLNSLVSSLSLYIARILECLGASRGSLQITFGLLHGEGTLAVRGDQSTCH